MEYQPSPIDTSDIQLPQELDDLIEQLSENAHDVWAQARLAEGWTHGPRRDDELKQHPDLIPYEELPEGEKDLDRGTVVQTLKGIIALGYTIVPPGGRGD